MIRVLFFARLREQLGVAALDWPWSPDLPDVAALRQALIASKGADWEQTLMADNVVIARNQNVVDASAPLSDGDEVAFFPPVTGG